MGLVMILFRSLHETHEMSERGGGFVNVLRFSPFCSAFRGRDERMIFGRRGEMDGQRDLGLDVDSSISPCYAAECLEILPGIGMLQSNAIHLP